MIKHISSKTFIGRFIQENGIEDTNFTAQAPVWLEDAISIMCVPNYYVFKGVLIDIKNKQGILPCDIEFMHSVYIAKGDDFSERHNIERLVIRNAPIINPTVHIPNSGLEYAHINGRYIYTTFDKGKVYLLYKGIPCDEEGYPLIPNDAHFNEAVSYYFIKLLSMSGYKHPVLSFKDAYELWNKHYPKAANSLNSFDLQEHQEFTEMWNNRILGDLHELDYII